jgi:hypothetical protein
MFGELKHRLYSAPMLTLPDLQQPFEIETDASDYAIGVQSLLNMGIQWHITVRHILDTVREVSHL